MAFNDKMPIQGSKIKDMSKADLERAKTKFKSMTKEQQAEATAMAGPYFPYLPGQDITPPKAEKTQQEIALSMAGPYYKYPTATAATATAATAVKTQATSHGTHATGTHATATHAKSKANLATDRQMLDMFNLYLNNANNTPDEDLELEVKFGTNGIKTITKINYDNVIKKLLSSGFFLAETSSMLRIQTDHEYNTDMKTGEKRLSNIRTEIVGMQNIQKYCQTNDIKSIETGVSFTQKSRFDETLKNVDVDDFNFRVSLSRESRINMTMPLVSSMIEKWSELKKTFRYLNRAKLRHPTLELQVDMSIVKESKKKGGRNYVPEYNIHDSGVFKSLEKYEIEIEVLNMVLLRQSAEELSNIVIKPAIKYILSGLQETNYPVGFKEQSDVLNSYMQLIWGKNYNEQELAKLKTSKKFVGPSSKTLEMVNIAPLNADSLEPNIRENYTVTDKADGERKLLFISPVGKIYLITTNMEVQFTGTHSKTTELWNTLIDGEHILYDKKAKFINMYAAFDIYYINGKDIRSNGFVPGENYDPKETNKYRLPLLEHAVDKINAVSVVNPSAPVPLKITKKRFYATTTQNIFQCCAIILKKEHDGLFDYETDGLIFTPANCGVNSDKIGEYKKPIKITWNYSFKWKPAKFNTIDFLVSIKKNANGTEDYIGSAFKDGTDISSLGQIEDYKTLILRVGYDESKHGYINPYQDMINDKIPNPNQSNVREAADTYIPAQFFPTEPSDPTAGICNIYIKDTDKYMYTENREIIEDNTIVEFRYEMEKPELWRWVPMRMRYDKTAQLRAGEPIYGNDYDTANSNWHSIYKPITTAMIMTGEHIAEELVENTDDDDVYYNKSSGESKTVALRNFHNLYVKKQLINSVAKPGLTLIDLAVGKGGDFPKWNDANLKFVFGVDISSDNILNRKNGACARYLSYRKWKRNMPAALFVNGDSSLNIRKTTGVFSEKDKQIVRAVFGQGPKDDKLLGPGVFKQFGVAADGFDICSIQFAIHYMFENQETLHNFLQNVSEVTKLGGYFIGTCYDGKEIFNMLKKKAENESEVIMVTDEKTGNKKKIWEVTKKYDHAEFNDDETSVGYAIDVFQESINKKMREYLVNFTYLTRMLTNYGFVLATSEELSKLNPKTPLTSGNGLFRDLFSKMKQEIQQNKRGDTYKDAQYMSDGERVISFLNRYFIYKKVHNVDAAKVSMSLQNKTAKEINDQATETVLAKKSVIKATAMPATAMPAATMPADTTTAAKPVKRTIKPVSRKKKTDAVETNVIEVPTASVSAMPMPAAMPASASAAAEPKTKKTTVRKTKQTLKI